MKRLLPLCLAMVMALSLTACGNRFRPHHQHYQYRRCFQRSHLYQAR